MSESSPQADETAIDQPASLGELARLFLKLGTIAFGGPAAHIAMMEDEVVRRRRWLTREQFLDMLGATNLIPGPNSTEMSIHIGYRRAGLAGLIVAGTCFIVPAVIIVTAIAWTYVRYGSLPAAGGILYGVKPVVIAIVAQALWRLGNSVLKTPTLIGAFVLATIASALGVNELLVLLGGAILVLAAESIRSDRHVKTLAIPALPAMLATSGAVATAVAAPFSLSSMFLVFLKIGSVLFGSGYVLLAFLRQDFVERTHWLTQSQLLDATAVGQVTPGPLFTTATFIGYLLGGFRGAIIATVGIFLPAFFFVAVSAPLLPKLRSSKTAARLLDGVNVASLALMAVVTVQLARGAVVDWITLALALSSAALLIAFNINATWLVGAGALVGYLVGKMS